MIPSKNSYLLGELAENARKQASQVDLSQGSAKLKITKIYQDLLVLSIVEPVF